MQKTKKFTLSLITALLFLSFSPVWARVHAPKAVDGVLDLSGWDFEKNGTVSLDGKWDFYWNRLLSPEELSSSPSIHGETAAIPHSWTNEGYPSNGFATYHLKVISPWKGLLGLKILDSATSYNLWINGKKLLKNGNPAASADACRPEYRPQVTFFSAEEGSLDIVIQVANFSHRKGGIWESITLGTPAQIHSLREKKINIEMFIIGSLMIMTFYHLGLFLFRRQEPYTLFFGLLCLSMTIRTGFIGERIFPGFFPSFPWELLNKIEYISAYACIPLFIVFLSSLFKEDINTRLLKYTSRAIYAAGIALSLFIVVFPVRISSYSLPVYSVIFLFGAFFSLSAMITAIRRKRDGAWLMLAGLLALTITVANDLLYSSQIINTGNYSPAGLFIFVLSQANIISLRFSHAFEKVETLTTQLTSNNTQLKNLNAQLELKNREITRRLFVDKLTELPNRQSLFIDIGTMSNPILLLIDIDSFKEINDFYGNKIGDYVLREVANMIKSLLSAQTQSIYKLSVDEYAILIHEEMDERTISQFTHYICREVGKNPIRHGTNEIFTRVTIGVAIGSLGSQNGAFEEIIVRADMALKRAKRFGKPFLIYDESMQIIKEYEKNMMWARKLKNALDTNRIVPYFQPIINNSSGATEKYECLVRLIDEDGTVISPFHFLDIARKSRLYPEITKTVIRKSFETFTDTEYEFSINISVDDILDEDTRTFIFDTMNANQETSRRLVFELLESQGVESYSEMTDFITVTKSMGAKIAVDDFGSGYSNFEHILKLNIDYIKIDASLIKNIHFDRNSQAIVKTIAVFARELGLGTVAEYVHCSEVLGKVKELGITYSQGFHLGEPNSCIGETEKS
jgi:diguanylate cyclase (GGDEF)-like protein